MRGTWGVLEMEGGNGRRIDLKKNDVRKKEEKREEKIKTPLLH